MTDTAQHQTREPEPFVGIIHVPLAPNPLSLNSRDHWAKKAKHTRKWREFAWLNARRFPELGRCDVTLTWFVTTKHDRDEDNMYPLLKALCDGLVDAGVVLKDTAEFMGKTCRISPSLTGEAYMELRVVQR